MTKQSESARNVSEMKRYRPDDKSPWGSPVRVVRAVSFLCNGQ